MSGDLLPALPESLLAAIYRHAEEGYPEEVCGLLLGPRGHLDELRRCENRQNQLHLEDPLHFPRDARTAYNLGPHDLLFVDRSLSGDRPVQVIYHSHVDVGAYFSREDADAAAPQGELFYPVDYLVVDAQANGARGAKLFRYRAGQFLEVASFAKDPR